MMLHQSSLHTSVNVSQSPSQGQRLLTALLYNATVKPKMAPTNAPDAMLIQQCFTIKASVPCGRPLPCCLHTICNPRAALLTLFAHLGPSVMLYR